MPETFIIAAAHHKAPGSAWWEFEPGARTEILLRDPQGMNQVLAPYRLTLDWQSEAVSLLIERNGLASRGSASAALVHESLPDLYSVLDLPKPTAQTRMWRWVFRIARVPGLRRLLAMVGARARA
jgi:hypothetical protein